MLTRITASIRPSNALPLSESFLEVKLPPLVLASQSPRRSELLTTAGFTFTVRARPVEEVRQPGELPDQYARRLAQAKAEAAWEDRDEIILGADTIVVLDREVLEKPANDAEALSMLAKLSGREHVVITGVCLRHAGGALVSSESTQVRFLPLTSEEISDYVASGEPMDKAGAYAIQGLASKFVECIEGCYFNVIGLPLSWVYQNLKHLKKRVV
jgi:septum formation protein